MVPPQPSKSTAGISRSQQNKHRAGSNHHRNQVARPVWRGIATSGLWKPKSQNLSTQKRDHAGEASGRLSADTRVGKNAQLYKLIRNEYNHSLEPAALVAQRVWLWTPETQKLSTQKRDHGAGTSISFQDLRDPHRPAQDSFRVDSRTTSSGATLRCVA
jgi:hypothetical protein